jgi:hypothetical protein
MKALILSFLDQKANKVTAANAGWPPQFRIRGSRRWSGVAEFWR